VQPDGFSVSAMTGRPLTKMSALGMVKLGRNLVRGLTQKCQCQRSTRWGHFRCEGGAVRYCTCIRSTPTTSSPCVQVSPMEFPWNWNEHVTGNGEGTCSLPPFVSSRRGAECTLDRIRDHITSPSLCSAFDHSGQRLRCSRRRIPN
jgi:hypothetical protein